MRLGKEGRCGPKIGLANVYWSKGVLPVTRLLLLTVSVFLTLGMVLLPSLTGNGLGSFVSRAWLVFGVLVFAGNYLYFLEQEKRKSLLKMSGQIKAGTGAVLLRKRGIG